MTTLECDFSYNFFELKSQLKIFPILATRSNIPFGSLKIGLSYDAITSKIGKSGGTFELGLVYQFDLDARKCFGCPINE